MVQTVHLLKLLVDCSSKVHFLPLTKIISEIFKYVKPSGSKSYRLLPSSVENCPIT